MKRLGVIVIAFGLLSSACASAFTPPERIATYDLRNLSKDATLICYEGENEVTIHFFGGKERDTALIFTKTDVIAVFKNDEAFWEQNGIWRKTTTEELEAKLSYLKPLIDRCFTRFTM